MPRSLPALVLALVLAAAAPARAQQLTLPHLDWQTVRTSHFTIHYPASSSAWTLGMAARLESVYDAVSLLVGSAPDARITVIVEDPSNESNGFAIPLLTDPVIFVWPTPPGPRTGIADSRGWAELLSVHEYAHIAHLTRPTRNPLRRFVARLSPVQLGPVALRSPRWVAEGYATWVEGKLTGSGRPHSAWRAAVLRQWALEGKLPTYGQLSDDRRFYGGSMAYLAGSAYLEWLVNRSGDSSLVHVWRRMSARKSRSFPQAFAGVFGGYPQDLYGRFTAELTGRALEVERGVHAALGNSAPDSGVGRTVQALEWNTGDPAISRDGSLLALVVRARDEPSRVVVWKTAEEPEDSSVIRERERALRLDPEDVPAREWRPRPKRAVATLYPSGGVPYDEPRFLSDGDRLLLVRATGRGDGAARLDLFIWNFRTGVLDRITYGAGVRHADPAPDGRYAVGDRCVEGICDVVRVDLRTGEIELLAAGSPDVVYDRPRYSSDGSTVAVGVQRHGSWRIALLDANSVAPVKPRMVGPDDGANRYDPAFLAGDGSLVVTSDATGIPNIEVLDLATNTSGELTITTGAALAPEPDPRGGAIYFLRLHSRGLDLNVIADSVIRSPVFATSPDLAPATRVPPVPADALSTSALPESHPYGLGPRGHRLLPSLMWAPEGKSFGAVLASTDPVGRLTWVAQGLYGDRGTWRGGALEAAWRGALPLIGASFFYAEDRPSRQHGGVAGPAALDLNYLGAATRLELHRDYLTHEHLVRLGASHGRLDGPERQRGSRTLGFVEYRGAVTFTPGEWRVAPDVTLHGSIGRTDGISWRRGIASAGIAVTRRKIGIRGDASYGTSHGRVGELERFSLGGTLPPLFDPALLAQRVAMPALPAAVATGSRFASYRISLPGRGIRPYFWSASAGGELRQWQQVVGLEWTDQFDGLWPVRLPSARISLGLGYSLREPLRHETSAYLMLTYRP